MIFLSSLQGRLQGGVTPRIMKEKMVEGKGKVDIKLKYRQKYMFQIFQFYFMFYSLHLKAAGNETLFFACFGSFHG